jgi:two-component system, sensor histidine kinase SagS
VSGVLDKPNVLCLCDDDSQLVPVIDQLGSLFDLTAVYNPIDALRQLEDESFVAFCIVSDHHREAMRLGSVLQYERVLDGMPDGVVMLDADNKILWANERFRSWTVRPEVRQENFYGVLDGPEILGPDFCPFHTAMATSQPSSSTLRTAGNNYYQIHAAPLSEGGPAQHLVVSVRDVTVEMLQQQKLEAIHKAGMDLADLKPEEIFEMGVEERIDLLKANILHYTEDLLNFDVVEIRLLDQEMGLLEPLLSVGISEESRDRCLYARPHSNGVTGFVAATGKSYLCEDTQEDPLYIEGFAGAKSSLTVPLILHDQVIGTFNVESPEPRAFTESDLQFLEIFSRDMAISLNTLELLVAQKANTAQESVEAIHSAVALPIDEILNDAVNIMEKYIGHEPEVVRRLQSVLRNARDIKRVIQKVGQRMSPGEVVPPGMKVEQRPKLSGRRILVVDEDESVRNDAHGLLERYGCTVETAHEGVEGLRMVRNSGDDYDVIIADIRLSDLNGYELFVELKRDGGVVPMVLMTGFGYDPGHCIVNARREGLHERGILYKPFRLDQLLEVIETIIDETGNAGNGPYSSPDSSSPDSSSPDSSSPDSSSPDSSSPDPPNSDA